MKQLRDFWNRVITRTYLNFCNSSVGKWYESNKSTTSFLPFIHATWSGDQFSEVMTFETNEKNVQLIQYLEWKGKRQGKSCDYIDCFGEMSQEFLNNCDVISTNGCIQRGTFGTSVCGAFGASTDKAFHLFHITILTRSKQWHEISLQQ